MLQCTDSIWVNIRQINLNGRFRIEKKKKALAIMGVVYVYISTSDLRIDPS